MADVFKDVGKLENARQMWEQMIQSTDSDPELEQLVSFAQLKLKEIEEKEKSR